MKNIAIALGATCFLAACMGSGSDGEVIDTGNAELDALLGDVQVASDTIDAFDEADDYTPFSAVAVAAGVDGGTASYEGFAVYVEGTEPPMGEETVTYVAIGSFTATADFGTAEVNGDATDFFEVSNPGVAANEDVGLSDIRTSGPIAGDFEFDLDIFEADYGGGSTFAELEGTVTGSLTKADMTDATLTAVDVFGEFYGSNLNAFDASGYVEGENDTFQDIYITGLR